MKNLMILCLCYSILIYAETIKDPINQYTLTQALNTVCEEKTRTQQLLKDYIMIAMGNTYNTPKENLKLLTRVFDKKLKNIEEFFVPRIMAIGKKEKAEEIKKILSLWEEDKKILERVPTKEGALKLKKDFQEMLISLKAVRVLGKEDFVIIKKTGALCIEPLKMSNRYLMRAWGIAGDDYNASMKVSIKKVHTLFEEIEAYPHNNQASREQIKKARNAFRYFEIMYDHETTFIPSLIYKKADGIFDIIRELKGVYLENAAKGESSKKQ